MTRAARVAARTLHRVQIGGDGKRFIPMLRPVRSGPSPSCCPRARKFARAYDDANVVLVLDVHGFDPDDDPIGSDTNGQEGVTEVRADPVSVDEHDPTKWPPRVPESEGREHPDNSTGMARCTSARAKVDHLGRMRPKPSCGTEQVCPKPPASEGRGDRTVCL